MWAGVLPTVPGLLTDLHHLQHPPLMLLEACVLLSHTLLQPAHGLLQHLELLHSTAQPCAHVHMATANGTIGGFSGTNWRPLGPACTCVLHAIFQPDNDLLSSLLSHEHCCHNNASISCWLPRSWGTIVVRPTASLMGHRRLQACWCPEAGTPAQRQWSGC